MSGTARVHAQPNASTFHTFIVFVCHTIVFLNHIIWEIYGYGKIEQSGGYDGKKIEMVFLFHFPREDNN